MTLAAGARWEYGGYRPVTRADRTVIRFIQSVLIVAACLIIGLFLYSAQFSGAIRWFLSFLLIAVLAAVAWYLVLRRTREPSPLLPPSEEAEPSFGDLASLSATVRRAHEGLPFSQVLVTTRLRDAFSERTRLALGLSLPAMQDASGDPTRLRTMVHDPVLEDFLYVRGRDAEERYRWPAESKERGGFRAALDGILDRMEAWR